MSTSAPIYMPPRGDETAPTFDPTKPRELRRYFSELEFLFDHAEVTDHAERKRHAVRYVDIDVVDLWECIAEFSSTNATYDEFKTAVIKLYPEIDEDFKFMLSDMDCVVDSRLRLGIHSINDLADYHREFMATTTFLVTKGRLAAMEQERAFIRGFQPEFWSLIARRLQIKDPDHFPDMPYAVDNVMDAAHFVLRGLSVATSSPSPTATTTTISPPLDALALETLGPIFSEFTKSIVATLQQSNQLRRPRSSSSSSPIACKFCGGAHFMQNCEHVDEYSRAGKCRRNIEGKVILPSGAFVPKNIPGALLKDRVDEWHHRNPNQLAAGTLLNSTAPPSVLDYSPPRIEPRSTRQISKQDRIAAIEAELLALRARRPPSFVPAIQMLAQTPRALFQDEGESTRTSPPLPVAPVLAVEQDIDPERPTRDAPDTICVYSQDKAVFAVPRLQTPKELDTTPRILPRTHDIEIAPADCEISSNTSPNIIPHASQTLSTEIRLQNLETTTMAPQTIQGTRRHAAALEEDVVDTPPPEGSADTFHSAPPSIALTSSPYPSPPDASVANFDKYEPSYRTLHLDDTPDPDNPVVSRTSATFCSYRPLDDENRCLERLLDPGGQILDVQPSILASDIVHDDPPQQLASRQSVSPLATPPHSTNSQNVSKCFILEYPFPADDPPLENASRRRRTMLAPSVHSFTAIAPTRLFVFRYALAISVLSWLFLAAKTPPIVSVIPTAHSSTAESPLFIFLVPFLALLSLFNFSMISLASRTPSFKIFKHRQPSTPTTTSSLLALLSKIRRRGSYFSREDLGPSMPPARRLRPFVTPLTSCFVI